jgi:hypothetical protein
LAPKKCKGTPLKVFSGKEATLNRVILLIFRAKKQVNKYDVFLETRNTKGFRHVNSKTVYRRIDALGQEGWICQKGIRPGKVNGQSILYGLTLRGEIAIRLDKIAIEEFIRLASEDELSRFLDVFDVDA